MKKAVKIIGIIGMMLALLITTVYATEINVDVNEEAINLLSLKFDASNEEIINTDVFLAEENVLLKNDVNGNVYVVGTTINISSKNIDGDVFVIGETVVINSNITGNIYGVANNFNVSGSLKDAFVLAETMNLNENTTCRDFKVIGTNTNVDGNVSRDLYIASGDVNISNTGKVGGILSAVSESIGNKENVNNFHKIENIFDGFENTEVQMEKFIRSAAETMRILFFILAEITGLLIIAVILLFTSKKRINISELKEHGIKDALYGVLYYVISILVIIGLTLTIIGIPVAIVVCFVLWFVLWKITIPVASIQFTKAILKQENKSKITIWFVAFLIFTLVQATIFIPAGRLIKGVVSLYGFGYMIRSIIRKNKAEEITAQVEIV